MPAPTVGRVSEIARTDQVAGMRVDGHSFSDRAMVVLMPEAEGADPQVLSDGAEYFAFHQYGFLRVAGNRVVARGGLTAFRVQAPAGAERAVTLNGRKIEAKRDGDYVVYGNVKPAGTAAPALAALSPQVNLSFFPVELRLAQGGEGKAVLKIRGANSTPASGALVVEHLVPLTVTPDRIRYGPLAEGEEKEIPLAVTARSDAPERMFTLRVAPDASGGAQCCPEELPVSVGVVMTEDDRLPHLGDFVARSPRYVMRVSKTYGTSYYLLDRDGQRRHGPLYGLSLSDGFPGVRDLAVDAGASTHGFEANILHWGQECAAFWPGKKSLLAIPLSPGFRYGYRFMPEYIVFEIPQASGKEYALRLGLFANPRAESGTQQQSGGNMDGKGAEPYQWVCVVQPPLRDRLLIMTPPQSGLRTQAGGPLLTVDFRNMRQGSRMVMGFVRAGELNDSVARWGKEFPSSDRR
jgi:hypothetical protein